MGTVLERNKNINSGFDIKEIAHHPEGLNYFEILLIKGPRRRRFIIHQFLFFDKNGESSCFVECQKLKTAEKVLKMMFNPGFDQKWFSILVEMEETAKKPIHYSNPYKPWFYCSDTDIDEDIFFSED
ncbi:MAG: hypothetical protein WCG91_02470 [Candidatus Shapirobacteria bacterium]